VKFELLAPWWIIVPYLMILLSASIWQGQRVLHKGRDVLIRWGRRGILLLLPVLLALGPSIPGGTSSPAVANLDIIFAVDTTPSMGALDYNVTQQRIVGVKKDLVALAKKLQGAHLELITFDSNPNIIVPFTTDTTAFSTAVNGMTPEVSSYSQGSSIDMPISLVEQQLKADKATYPARHQLFFYLGDGEQTSGQAVQSFAPLAKYLSGGAVLSYGTPKGAEMIDNTGSISPSKKVSYIMTLDASTLTLVPGVSHMDPTTLQTIASQLKVKYQDRDKGGSINNVYQISKAGLAIDRSQHIVRYLNLYWLFAVPFSVLLFWEWQAIILRLFDLREPRGKSRHQHE
jgi:Ca-activated chloride channel family protein